ncbi:MAG: protoporphyrinogen oxidase, partial [bacterium]
MKTLEINHDGNWVDRLLGPFLRAHLRSSWIYSHRVYTRYPFQANTHGLPRRVVRDCVRGFVEAALADTDSPPQSFADWCLRTFGRGISREFMFPYNEKLWTVPLDQLTTDWMGRFVPRPKVSEVIAGGLLDQRTGFGYNARFLYPRHGGIQALAASIAGQVRSPHLGEEVVAVDLDRRRGASASGGVYDFDWLVSTLPLPALVRALNVRPPDIERAAAALRWNTILNINFGVDRPGLASGRHWIYFPEKRYPFYRVGFPSAISPAMHPRGTSSLYVEVAFAPGAPVDVAGSVRACRRGLETAGLLRKSDRLLVT